MTNTLKLKAAIAESGLNQEQIANMLNLSVGTFNYKLHNKNEFKESEIKKLIELLKLNSELVMLIFFADVVE